jgi:hypothetical protein
MRAENLERNLVVVLPGEIARRIPDDAPARAGGSALAISLRSSGANFNAPMPRAISSWNTCHEPRMFCMKIAHGRRPKSCPISTSTPGTGSIAFLATCTARLKSGSTGLPSRRGDTRLSTFASIHDFVLPGSRSDNSSPAGT